MSREIANSASTVERLRRTLAIMARSKYGDPPRVLLHPRQRPVIRNIYPGPCWTSMRTSLYHLQTCVLESQDTERVLGSVMGVL